MEAGSHGAIPRLSTYTRSEALGASVSLIAEICPAIVPTDGYLEADFGRQRVPSISAGSSQRSEGPGSSWG